MHSDDKIMFLEAYSKMSGIDLETLLSMYIVLEDNLFYVLNELSGSRVYFPRLAVVRATLRDTHSEVKDFSVVELSNKVYRNSSGSVIRADDIVCGSEFVYNDCVYKVLKEPITFLGHKFVFCHII